MKRELKRRLIYEYRCDGRLKTKNEESTRLADTGFVYCLTAAVHALPLVRTDLPTHFLVPSLKQLAGKPHVLRCVEMLEMGTASRFQPSQRCKPYVWEASFPPKSVELSENSRGRVEFSENDSL
jgi:hypothetical protein